MIGLLSTIRCIMSVTIITQIGKTMLFLRKSPLFKHLEDRKLEMIAAFLEKHSYNKNEMVFLEGTPASHMYIVLDGKVKMSKTSVDGKEHIIKIMKRNDVIGEAPMFKGGNYPANCVALTPAVLFSISREKLVKLIENDPKIALGMLALQAERLGEFALKIERLTLQSIEQRLAGFCIRTIENSGKEAIVGIGNTQELASYLGATREHLSRIMSNWVKLGYISKQHGMIIPKNIEMLKKIAYEV